MGLPTTEPRLPVSKYTYSQLQDLWKSVGGSAVAAPFAAAVALAESGGNSGSINHNSNGTVDRGLWQINSIHGGLSTVDPKANARAAVQISNNGTNWRPWCVAWSNGRCGGTFLGAGSPVFQYFTGSVGGVGMSTPNSGPTDSSVSAQNVGNPLSAFDPRTWATAFLRPIFTSVWFGALAWVGAMMMIAGVLLLVSESRTADLVRGLGGKALKSNPETAPVGVAVEAKQEEKESKQESSSASRPERKSRDDWTRERIRKSNRKRESSSPVRRTESPAEREIRERKERDPSDLGY